MKAATLLAAVAMMGAGALLTAAPVEAQGSEGAGAFGYPLEGPVPQGYPPPDYAYRDGEVYVDGDEVLDCRTFVEVFDEGYDEWGDQEQAERVLERCKQAGLPTSRPPAEVRREIRQDVRSGTLPETGGVSPSFLAAGLLLAGAAGSLALRRVG